TPAMVTGVGTLLGTAAYMSPEQAKGRPADKRSDVWAFGCVLYEMLTGKHAFEGDDVSDTLAAVLRGEPDWTALSQTPVALQKLVQRCLEKDRGRRSANVAAARFVLDEPSLADAAPRPASPAAVTSLSRRVALAVILAAGAALIFAGIWILRRSSPAP